MKSTGKSLSRRGESTFAKKNPSLFKGWGYENNKSDLLGIFTLAFLPIPV
jgi:hypothetical protein